MRKSSSSFSRRIAVLALFCLSAQLSFSQLQSLQQVRDLFTRTDSLTPFDAGSAPTSENVNVLADSTTTIEALLRNILAEDFRSIRHDTLKQSAILTDLAGYAIHRWSGSYYKSPKSMKRIRRRINRVFNASHSPFGMISVLSFSVPLVEHAGHFYHDVKGTAGGFNLYKGRRKPKPTKENPEPETEPLRLLTEVEVAKLIQKQLNRNVEYKELTRGIISYAGLAVIPDKRTFFRAGKTPQVRVVVLLGAKRLQMIRR